MFPEGKAFYLYGEITEQNTIPIITDIVELNETNAPVENIVLYIHSDGGSVTEALALYDVIKLSSIPVSTCVLGKAYSMAAIVLGGGHKRYALKHSEIMIHRPSGSIDMAPCEEVQKFSNSLNASRDTLINILHKDTGQKKKKIREDLGTDHFMSPKQAKAYGLIDEIIVGI